MKKYLLAIAISTLSSACTSTGPEQAPPAYTNSKGEFAYSPEGREEFVFGAVSPTLQQFAYEDICFKKPVNSIARDCSSNRLPYKEYVGKRGFFTGEQSFKDSFGHTLEAVLETGEIIHIVKSDKYKHVGETFISMKEHNKISGFKPIPIVQGAKTIITGYSDVIRGNLNVSSQNKHSFSESEIDAIKYISAMRPKHSARIADLLSTLNVDVDEFNNNKVVSYLPYNNKESFISVRVIITPAGNYTPFVEVHYQGEDWLFVRNYSVSADGFNWDSPNLSFERDHSRGTVWEWNTTSLNVDVLSMLDKLSSSSSAKIRFYGQQYYKDYDLTQDQKKELSSLIEFLKILKS